MRHLALRAEYLLLSLACVGSGGCLAALLGAAGGAGGYAYYKGNVCHAFPAAFDDVWLATRAALTDLAMPIVDDDRAGGIIESRTGDGAGVRIHVKTLVSRVPADGILTRVCVRVAVFGDQQVSDRILTQIGLHLRPVDPSPPGPIAPVPAG